jgi:hypothetical protein
MTARTFIVTLFALMLFSCNNNRTQDNARQETPKALEDNNLSYEIITKQGYEDLIESLYSELVSRDIDLKKLEDQIEELNKSKADSTNLFDKYNGKNQSYFTSANSHISKINDSILKNRMNILVAHNLAQYTSLTARHTELMKAIEGKRLTI